MTCLSLNCCGLGNPRAVHFLCSLVRAKSPILIFLTETKQNSPNMEKVKVAFRFDACFVVEANGTQGGLALLGLIKQMFKFFSIQIRLFHLSLECLVLLLSFLLLLSFHHFT